MPANLISMVIKKKKIIQTIPEIERPIGSEANKHLVWSKKISHLITKIYRRKSGLGQYGRLVNKYLLSN